jgi:hypothetical protein
MRSRGPRNSVGVVTLIVQARELLVALVGVDANSEVEPARRCIDLTRRIGAHDVALHYALCLWCASPRRLLSNRAAGARVFVAGDVNRGCAGVVASRPGVA